MIRNKHCLRSVGSSSERMDFSHILLLLRVQCITNSNQPANESQWLVTKCPKGDFESSYPENDIVSFSARGQQERIC